MSTMSKMQGMVKHLSRDKFSGWGCDIVARGHLGTKRIFEQKLDLVSSMYLYAVHYTPI